MVARSYRLREESDVRRVRTRGKAVAHGALVARILANDLDPTQNRYTVIAGKRCGNAVERNRLKRLTREALRGFHPYLRTGFDVALVCRGTVAEMPTLVEAQTALERIFTRADLLLPADETNPPPRPGDPVTARWRLPSTTAAEDVT